MTYTMYMHGIYVTYTSFAILWFCKVSKEQSILDGLEIHVRCMDFQDNYLITLKRHDLLSDRIYQGYTRYIPCIYQTYTIRRSLASPLSCPSALGSLRPRLLIFSVLATERPPTRGWGRPKFHSQVLIS